MSDQNTDAPLPAFASSDNQQQHQHLTVMSHHHHQQQHNNSNSNSGFGFNSGEGTGGCLSSGQASTIAPGDIPTPTAHPQQVAFAQPPLLSTRDPAATSFEDPDGDDDDDAGPPTERSSRSSSFASLPPSTNTLEEDMLMLRRNRESNDNNGSGFMLPQGRDAFVPARLRRRNSRAGLVDLDEDHDPLSASNHAGSGNGGSSSFRSGGAHARPPISPFAPPGTSFGGGGGGLQLNLSELSGSPNFSNAGGDSAAHNNNNNNNPTGSNGGHPPPLHFLGSPEGGFVMSSAGSNTIQYGTTSLLSSGSRQSFSTSHHASNHLQYSPSWKPIITAPNLFVASQRDVNVFENHAAYSITAFLCMALEATPPSFLLAGSSHNRAFLESVCQGESQLDEIQDAQHHQQPPLPQRYTTQQSTDAGDASFTSIFTNNNNNNSVKNLGNPTNNPFTTSNNNNNNSSNTPSQFFCQPEHPKSHLCFPDSTVTDGDVTINSTTYSFLKISMKDNSDQQLKPNFDKAFAFIDQMRKQNRNVVVYCQQGKSRSVSTVVGWLMRRQKIPYEQAFSMVKQARRQAEPNPYFMDQLRRVNANASATGGPLIPSGYASQYESRRGSVTLAGPNSPGTQNLTLSQLQLRTPLPTNFSCESLDHHHHQQQQQYYLDHPHQQQQQQQFDGSGGGGGDPMSDDGGGGSHGRNKSRKPPANWGQFHCFKTPEVGSPSISSPLAGVSLDPNSVQQPSFESGAIPELVLDVQHASPTTHALANARDSSDGGGSDGAFVSRHNSDTNSLHGQYKQYQQQQQHHHHHTNNQHHHHPPNLQNHATIFARASGDSGSSPSHHNNNTNAVVSPDGTFGMDHSNLSGPGLSPAGHQHHNNFVSSSSINNLAPPPPGNTSMRSNSSLTLMVPSPGLESVPVSASHSQLRRSTSGMSGISPHMRITPQHHQQLQRAHFTRSTSPQPPVLMHLSNDGYSAASNSVRFSSDASPGSATHHQGNSNFQQYSTNNNVAAAPGQTLLGTPMSAIAHHNPNSATVSYDDAWNASVVAELETNEKEEEEEVHAMLSGGGVLSDEK